jgi:Family of unknown function (DUF5677)
VNFEEQLANTVLEKTAHVAKERNLNEEEIKNLIDVAVKAAFTDGVEAMANGMTAQLTRQIPEIIEQERKLQATFEQRLYNSWQKALDLFDATVILTREAGERFLKKYREQTVRENEMLIEALVSIHSRACQTAAAISVLLKSGFARDALARQRTLHELAVVALLLEKHGTSLAERFLLHERIETWAAAEQYEQAYVRLGDEPPDPANLADLRDEKARLCQLFGEDFKNHYGWAAEVIGSKRPKFEDLEKATKLDHLRPYYRMAGYGIHATAKGMVFDIGTIQSHSGTSKGLLAGASNAGLADPGHGSLLSLYQCTVALLTSKIDIEASASLRTLQNFVDEAGQAFLHIHREQIQEEKLQADTLKMQQKDEKNNPPQACSSETA